MKAGIVGCGNVGRAVAAALVTTGAVREVLLHSRREQETDGLMRDVQDAAAATRSHVTVSGALEPGALADCDVLVLAVRGQFPSRTPGADHAGGEKPRGPPRPPGRRMPAHRHGLRHRLERRQRALPAAGR
ncbi:NAD(P)-binding domain-containing protein [Saccharopolyspora cebuensis]|uniref:NAD(P)-binding domain-containing protein n=1 Tax=Saccharopolyspora cebuensis TaxID=418759 RepID=A0ABV4CQW8_9PSEU